jgi:hypothetical protein
MYGDFINLMMGGCPYSIISSEYQIGAGTSSSSSVPFYGLYDYSVYAGIWLDTEFTSGGKQINGIELEVKSYTTPYTYNDVKIYLAEVVEDTFDSAPAVDGSDLTITNETLCFEGNITISSNGWQVINFNVGNMCYDRDSGRNLYMRVENRDGTWQSGFGRGKYDASPAISRAMHKATDTNYPTGNGTRTNSRVNTKFKI